MRCPALMKGYYREEAQTADAFTSDGWLRTGDKGQIDAQGFLSITGRVKDIFKTSKGKYVAPAPIEDRLVLHPDIEACAVTGANLAQPLALVMLSPDAVARSQSSEGRQALRHFAATAPANRECQTGAPRETGLPGCRDYRVDPGEWFCNAHTQGQAHQSGRPSTPPTLAAGWGSASPSSGPTRAEPPHWHAAVSSQHVCLEFIFHPALSGSPLLGPVFAGGGRAGTGPGCSSPHGRAHHGLHRLPWRPRARQDLMATTPELAGKPAGYLYNQLRNFQEGRRHYTLMAGLLAPLGPDYLRDMATYFSELEIPYPPPARSSAPAAVLERGKTLVLQGDRNFGRSCLCRVPRQHVDGCGAWHPRPVGPAARLPQCATGWLANRATQSPCP